MDVVAALRSLTFVEVLHVDAMEVELSLVFSEERARVRFKLKPDGTVASLDVHGSLPVGEDRAMLRLRPQQGIIAAVDALNEIHVDDAAIDAAFVIHGEDPALLLAILPELRSLAPWGPSIDVDETIDIAFTGTDELAVGAALALWHRVVFFRMGVS